MPDMSSVSPFGASSSRLRARAAAEDLVHKENIACDSSNARLCLSCPVMRNRSISLTKQWPLSKVLFEGFLGYVGSEMLTRPFLFFLRT